MYLIINNFQLKITNQFLRLVNNALTTLLKTLLCLIILPLSNYCYAEESTLKIAVVAPFIGKYSSYGKQLLMASHKAATDLNANPKHLVGKLELVPFDDQCNPDLAKSIAKKIVEQRIPAVIGHVCSEATLAASPIYAKHGILNIVPFSTNTKITEQNISTLFRMCGKDDMQAQHISKFLYQNFNEKKIAILHSQDLYSKELAAKIQEQLAILNLTPTLYQSITIDQFNNATKLKNIIKKLKKLNIDIIFLGALYSETADFIRVMHSNKTKIPIISSDNIATPGFIEELRSKNIAAGTMMSFPKIDNPGLVNDGQAIFGYAAIQVVAEVFQQNTSTNGRILAHWLHHHTVNTILGATSWDTNGDIINSEFATYIWDDNGQYWPLP